MSQAGTLAVFADALISAVVGKLERDVIVAKVKELESKGADLAQISKAIAAMTDEEIAKAQAEIDKAPG